VGHDDDDDDQFTGHEENYAGSKTLEMPSIGRDLEGTFIPAQYRQDREGKVQGQRREGKKGRRGEGEKGRRGRGEEGKRG
jgi:hypothetical protein